MGEAAIEDKKLVELRAAVELPQVTREDCRDFRDFHTRIQRRRATNHLVRTPERARLVREHSGAQLARIRRRAPVETPVVVVLIPDENQINPWLQELVFEESEARRYEIYRD